MLDDDFAALDALGQRILAYTDGTPENQERLAASAALQSSLTSVVTDSAATLATTDFSSFDGLAAAEAASGRLAVATAALAALA